MKKLTLKHKSTKNMIYEIDQSGKTFFQQKTRLLSEFFDELHTDALAPDLRCLYNTKYADKCQVKNFKNCVEVRGIEPPQADFVGQQPHQCTPTAILLYQKLEKIEALKKTGYSAINGTEGNLTQDWIPGDRKPSQSSTKKSYHRKVKKSRINPRRN